MRRREFFGTSATFLSAWVLSSCRSQLPPTSGATGSKGKIFLSLKDENAATVVRILDLDDDSYKDFTIPIDVPHSLVRSQLNPDMVFAVGINGPSAILNMKNGESVVKEASSEKGFHGHALQVEEGKTLWCSEIIDDIETVIRKRNATDFSLVENTSFPGGHHVSRLPGTNTLISGGSHKDGYFMVFFDMVSGKVTKEIELPDFPVHFLPLSSSEVIIVTGTKYEVLKNKAKKRPPRFYTPVLHVTTEGKVTELWGDKNIPMMFGFGHVALPQGRFVTGHVKSNTLHLWENMQLKKTVRPLLPSGIVLSEDKSQIIVLSDRKLIMYSPDDLREIRTIEYDSPIKLLSAY